MAVIATFSEAVDSDFMSMSEYDITSMSTGDWTSSDVWIAGPSDPVPTKHDPFTALVLGSCPNAANFSQSALSKMIIGPQPVLLKFFQKYSSRK